MKSVAFTSKQLYRLPNGLTLAAGKPGAVGLGPGALGPARPLAIRTPDFARANPQSAGCRASKSMRCGGNTSASAPSQQRYLLVEPQHLDEPRRRRRTISTSYFIFFVNLKDGPPCHGDPGGAGTGALWNAGNAPLKCGPHRPRQGSRAQYAMLPPGYKDADRTIRRPFHAVP